jgi:hypothetical protein
MDNTGETTRELPGNPGGWYLDLLGVEEAAPTPQGESARSHAAATTFTIDGSSESSSTPTPLEAPVKAPPPETHDLEPGEETDFMDFRPEGLAKQVESKRNFRWSIVVTLAIILAIVIAAIVMLPATVETEAREEATAYASVLDAMRATLPDTQQTLASATDPATSAIDLLPLSAQLTRLDAAAGEVVTRAARPLPDTLPLLSRAPLEELVPTRDKMQLLGEDGTSIVARISTTIAYRTTLDGILVYPSLPVRADPSQVNGLGVSLAETLAQSSAILIDLPLDPAFDTHRLQVAAAVDSFEDWQTAYLDALRRDDQALTATLITQAAAIREGVFTSIVPSLATIRSEVDAVILDLNSATTETIAAIPS